VIAPYDILLLEECHDPLFPHADYPIAYPINTPTIAPEVIESGQWIHRRKEI
jgi:hypothetical protein